MTLGVLAESEAVALVRPIIGERADSEPEAVRTLARRCGNLPLALRVAAEHVASRPAVPLAYLVVELNDTLNHLDAFGTAGDERADLRSVFSWSVRRLPAQAARAFHLLGIVPGSDADVYGIAALAGVDLPEAGRLAQVMTQAHLIQPDGHGRFGLHDLLRAYAREGAARTVGPDECRAAATRLLDHYITSATVAVDLQFPDMVPDRRRNRPGPVLPTPALAFECVRAAAHWLAAQRDSVVRACMHAARHGWPGHAVALAQVVRPLLDNGHDRDGLTVLSEALDAAVGRPECDPLDVAFLHVWLALTNWRLGRIDAAAAHGEQALRETTRLACAEGITHSLVILGAVRYSQGRSPTRSTASSEGWRRHSTRATRMQEAGQLNNLTGGRP